MEATGGSCLFGFTALKSAHWLMPAVTRARPCWQMLVSHYAQGLTEPSSVGGLPFTRSLPFEQVARVVRLQSAASRARMQCKQDLCSTKCSTYWQSGI